MPSTKVPDSRPGRPRVFWTPLVVLVLSLLAFALAAVFVGLTARARDQARFRTAIRSTTGVIRERLHIYESVLQGAAAFFAVEGKVTRQQFKDYAEHLNLQSTYPGIQGIGFAQKVRAPDRARFLQDQRAAGTPAFNITPPGDRSEYFPVVWLEPLDRRNRQAIGFDMFAEEIRHEAMARARDQGRLIASGKVTLMQEIDPVKQPGFLLFIPVYDGGDIPATPEERREKILGFVYSPFRADDLFQAILGESGPAELQLEVYDGAEVRPGALLHRSTAELSTQASLTQKARLDFAGHEWTLRFRTTQEFEAGSYTKLLPWVVAAGLLLSLTLGAITAALARAHRDLHVAQDLLKSHAARLEGAVAERTGALRETINELEQMSYSMVHDMRAPLRAIQGFAGLLQAEAASGLNETCRDYIHRIRTASSRMDALIRDMLNYGKLVRQELPLQRVDLAPLIRGIVETYPLLSTVEADIHIAPEIPAVLGNEAALTQCFSNLLSNAIKFVAPGTRPVVRITGERRNDRVLVCVHDNGVGIPKEYQGKIFGLFQRLDTSPDGTGTGLAIVRKATERMGGSVSFESESGRGSRFCIELKAA